MSVVRQKRIEGMSACARSGHLAHKAIDTPILVADGDHDEAIKREHTEYEYIAAMIPHAGLLILPDTSHFAFLQDPRQFNFAILHFLGDE
jgi:pimeloyl-ACP methyl ester carboxylesterase